MFSNVVVLPGDTQPVVSPIISFDNEVSAWRQELSTPLAMCRGSTSPLLTNRHLGYLTRAFGSIKIFGTHSRRLVISGVDPYSVKDGR